MDYPGSNSGYSGSDSAADAAYQRLNYPADARIDPALDGCGRGIRRKDPGANC